MYGTLDPATTPCQGSYFSTTAVQSFDIRIDRVNENVCCVVLVLIVYLGYHDMGPIIRQLQVRYGRWKVKTYAVSIPFGNGEGNIRLRLYLIPMLIRKIIIAAAVP